MSAVVPGTVSRRGDDLRLAAAVGFAWLLLALCLDLSPAAVLLVAGGGGALGVAGLAARMRWLRVAAAAGLCTAIVLVPFAGRMWAARASPLWVLAHQHAAVTLELVTSGDPRPLAATGVAGTPRVAVPTDAARVSLGTGTRAVSGAVLVLAPANGWRDTLPGQRVEVSGTLQPSLDGDWAGTTLFAQKPPALLGQPPWWQRAAGVVRAGLRDAATVLPDDERGLLPGLVDGDTTGLDPVLAERFRVAGLTHLVAVSGTNCSIVVGVVVLLLRRARVRPWLCAAAGGAVLVAFVVVARPSPSVLRAAVMAGIALICLATGRPRAGVPVLAASVLILLVAEPGLSVDAGFTMSVLATAALLLVAPGWAAALRRKHVPAGVAEALAVATAAHVVTAPVIAAISGRLSLVAVPANVLAEPAVALATVLGFAAAVVAPWWGPGGRGLAWLAGWPCRWLVGVADRLGALPGARVSWAGGLVGAVTLLAVTVVVLLMGVRSGVWRVVAVGVVAAVLVEVPVRSLGTGWPPPGWIFVACDIGQGDALVLHAGPHTAVEVDAGPDPIAVDRCLRELGVDDIALLAFTHFHLDHVGGLAGVLHGRRVERVVAGPLAEPVSGVAMAAAQLGRRRLTITTPAVGARFDIGAVHLEVLGPAEAFHGTRSDPNNSSLVMRAVVDGVSILLPGDVEVEAQQAMLTAGVDVRADVLKVPHHGSAYSDPDFLAAVGAKAAVISVGLNNDYGHPSPVLLADLARLGLPVRRTDLDGDVAVVGPRARLGIVVHGVGDRVAAARAPPWLSSRRAVAGRGGGAGDGRRRRGTARARPPAPRAGRPGPLGCTTRSRTRRARSAARRRLPSPRR